MSSYPKSKASERYRVAEPKKRKFHGHRKNSSLDSSSDLYSSSSSASGKKLATTDHDVSFSSGLAYRIIEFYTVFNVLADILVCKSCKQKIRFEETAARGLGFKLVVVCKCGKSFAQSGPLVETTYEINRRIVLVMRLLGVGMDGINLFCNFMDICKGISQSSYDRVIEHLHVASESIFNYCCSKAVEEEQKENEKMGTSSYATKSIRGWQLEKKRLQVLVRCYHPYWILFWKNRRLYR